MKATAYRERSKRMEELLKLLTEKDKLSKAHQDELDRISDEIADFEEEHFPFKAEKA